MSENSQQNFYLDFSVQNVREESHRVYASILNKSSMHSVNISDKLIRVLPDVPQNTQKLDISHNMLKIFPLNLKQLKEARLSHNLIQRIPIEINEIPSLTIILLSHNNISTLPFLKYVRHLELSHNPIKVITTALRQMKLQFLSFDWIPYLIDSVFENRDVVLALCDLIDEVNHDHLDQFIDFHKLFTSKKKKVSLIHSLHKAIMKGYDFFIYYTLDCYPQFNFNELVFGNTPLLQSALEQQYTIAIDLFMLRKANLSSLPVYMMNLLLACKYGHLELFNFVVGMKRSVLIENQDQIFQTILKHFNPKGSSPIILQKLLKCCNYTFENPKIFTLPISYNILFIENLAKAILCVMQDDILSKLIDFNQAICSQNHSLIHFAVTARKPELVRQILLRHPSAYSEEGKSARFIRGSALSRKMIWKNQKLSLKKKIQSSFSQKGEEEQKNNWVKIIFTSEKGKNPNQRMKADKFIGNKINKKLKVKNEKNKIKMLGKKQKKNDCCSQEEQNGDKMGIFTDISLNYLEVSSDKLGNLDYLENDLSLYEIWRSLERSKVEHDYSEIKVKQKQRFSFFASPLALCQDIDDSQEVQSECVVQKRRKHRKIKQINVQQIRTDKFSSDTTFVGFP